MSSPSPLASPFRDVYTVSRLNLEARELIEDAFATIWIEGELSNLARPRSGHIYFSLKDERCQVRCAMFRGQNRLLDFDPRDGVQVLAQARVGLYPERGEFQLVVEYMEEAGAGALRRAFEALRQRLAAEGLFDPERKRPPPPAPSTIGVITSPTGAALRDVLSVIGRRWPVAEVVVYPVPVQGEGAAARIARMIDLACRRAECDVLLLCRGGGSLEDLWAFNEEVVARAIHRASIPIVTGIGHETDFTIADLAADARAPTPSAAAEMVTPDGAQWRSAFARMRGALDLAMRRRLREARSEVAHLGRRLVHPRRRLTDHAQRLDGLAQRLARAMDRRLERGGGALARASSLLTRHDPARRVQVLRQQHATLERRLVAAQWASLTARRSALRELDRALTAVGPLATLARGYAIVSRADDGLVVRHPDQAPPGTRLRARLADGSLDATVTPPPDADAT
ncbi:MAG: exodeoxyribonuclease VII large subunit [Ectothiorhodospiraceae bacterium]|nr:exodeoxyribonuclease VII large subunit [Chromatiales bacterium]MCP5153980.1 exodeoxyribonuclease VII large subunit [Ectothiorhodospiraceae bacterium]